MRNENVQRLCGLYYITEMNAFMKLECIKSCIVFINENATSKYRI